MTIMRRVADVIPNPAPGSSAPMAWLTRVAVSLAITFGALGIIGWLTGIAALQRIYPGAAEARFNAAVVVVLLGIAWFVPPVVRAILASAGLVITGATIFEQVTRLDLGIDQLVVNGAPGHFPGRMTVMASGSLTLLALVHLLLLARSFRWAQSLASLVILVSFLLVLGLIYSVHLRAVALVAASTVTAVTLLSIAALAAVPGGALSWALTGQDPGATLIRRLAPLALLGLPALGFVCVLAGREGVFNSTQTSAMIVVLSAVTVGWVAWTAARRVSRVDRRRAQAIAELSGLRLDLERRIQERAHQLQRRHEEIAVLEDRQRIAADLHDIVIQRLFAAGMYLQSGADGVDEETRRRLDSAVESMDIAIKDLRASIFELGGRTRVLIGTRTAISDVCADSARVLGFEPHILIEDPNDDSEVFREDILAVVRESLANVARHAEASSVDVVLRTGDGKLWLSIADDGKGMITSSRRGGTRNMAQRAREYGGDCVWARLEPTGTRVLWRVPLQLDMPIGEPTPGPIVRA